MINKLLKRDKNSKTSNKLNFIITAGFAGSGKTTLAKRVAKELGYPLLDKDTVTRHFTDFLLEQTDSDSNGRESDFYVNKVRDLEYLSCYRICEENFHLGNSVVFSAPFIKELSDYKFFASQFDLSLLDSLGVSLKILWIEHDLDTEKLRIMERGAKRDDYKLAHWSEYEKSIANFSIDPSYHLFTYSSASDVDENAQMQEVFKWLEQ